MGFTREDTKVIKGIAIVLMLFHHLFFFPERIAEEIAYLGWIEVGGAWLAFLIGRFGKFCVALFLFLGGYGIHCASEKYAEDHSALSDMIYKRILNLYLEYWKVFAVFVPVCILAGTSNVVLDIQSLIWNITALDITYCGEWWFFRPYAALLFTYPVVQKALRGKDRLQFDLLCVLFLNLFVGYVLPCVYEYRWAAKLSESLFWDIFSEMLSCAPAFYMGCVAAKYDLLAKIRKTLSGSFLRYGAACAVMAAIFCLYYDVFTLYDYIFAPIFTGAAIAVLSLPAFRWLYKLLEKIGQEGTVIWLVHSLYCYHLCQRLVFLPRYNAFIFLWLLAMCYVTAIVMRAFYDVVARGMRKSAQRI